MRLLLDTPVWLWLEASPERIRANVRETLGELANEVYLSAASSWEIAIKYSIGKLSLPMKPAEYVTSRLERSDILELPVTHRHSTRVADLPPYHKDPFDRLLVAQALVESMALVTSESWFAQYGVPLLEA